MFLKLAVLLTLLPMVAQSLGITVGVDYCYTTKQQFDDEVINKLNEFFGFNISASTELTAFSAANFPNGTDASVQAFLVTYHRAIAYPIVVEALAFCSGCNRNGSVPDPSKCVTLAAYEETQCSTATMCDYVGSGGDPIISTDCSGISSTFPNCSISCNSTSLSFDGLDSCTNTSIPLVDKPPLTTAPVGSPTGAVQQRTSGAMEHKTMWLVALALLLL